RPPSAAYGTRSSRRAQAGIAARHRRLCGKLRIGPIVRAGTRRYEMHMKVDGKPMRSIWLEPDGWSVGVIDQTVLPHRFATLRWTSLDDAAHRIHNMQVRGAPV